MTSKKDLIDLISEKLPALSRRQAGEVVDKLLEGMAERLKGGEEVRLPGLGVLKVVMRPARVGRHPATGALIQIRAAPRLKFRSLAAGPWRPPDPPDD